MKPEEYKKLIKEIQNTFDIVLPGLKIINDQYNHKERGVHGIPNQYYDDKVLEIVNDIGKIVTKMKVYERVLADTWNGRLLKKANTILQNLVKYNKPNGGRRCSYVKQNLIR